MIARFSRRVMMAVIVTTLMIMIVGMAVVVVKMCMVVGMMFGMHMSTPFVGVMRRAHAVPAA